MTAEQYFSVVLHINLLHEVVLNFEPVDEKQFSSSFRGKTNSGKLAIFGGSLAA